MIPDAYPIDSEPARYVFTLVHGTFAPRATWTRPESTFCTTVRRRLGGGVPIVSFNWSGSNSPSARQQASTDLSILLANQVRRHSSTHHFVIGHSHGGNVAISAAVRSGVLDKIGGVVCLATPFLVAHERDVERKVETFAGVLLVIALAGPLMVDTALARTQRGHLVPVAVKVVVLSALLVAATLVLSLWQKHADRFRRALAFESIDRDKLLIVRSPADEASGLLVFGQFVSQLTVRVYLVALRTVIRVERAARRLANRRWALAAVALVSLLAAFLLTAIASKNAAPPWIGTVAWAGFYSSFALLIETIVRMDSGIGVASATLPVRLVVAMLTWPIIFVLSLFLVLPFGFEVALANFLLDVTAETTPAGAWTVHMFEPPTSEDSKEDDIPLMHSVSHEILRVIAFVADWIAERASVGAADCS